MAAKKQRHLGSVVYTIPGTELAGRPGGPVVTLECYYPY